MRLWVYYKYLTRRVNICRMCWHGFWLPLSSKSVIITHNVQFGGSFICWCFRDNCVLNNNLNRSNHKCIAIQIIYFQWALLHRRCQVKLDLCSTSKSFLINWLATSLNHMNLFEKMEGGRAIKSLWLHNLTLATVRKKTN